jgi:5-formyltetrahydrofolate cyclo-ligase
MTVQDDAPAQFASPPCFMHELDENYIGVQSETHSPQTRDVARWRKSERQRLIAERLAIEPGMRKRYSAEIIRKLDAIIGTPIGYVVSGYWPLRGEPDLRPWVESLHARGGQFALPVVVERNKPLIFRLWSPGVPLIRGFWNIPVPNEQAAEVVPDIVIAPVIGFDSKCYRLGYGGGYFDRTLEAIGRTERVLGVGYAQQAIPTIYAQSHDMPMDAIVTERETFHPQSNGR